MEKDNVFAARLRSARLMRGYSQERLSLEMDRKVSKMAISKYENAQARPGTEALMALSRALEQPIDYFFRPFSARLGQIRFRKRSKLSAKAENSLKERLADFVERYIQINEILGLSLAFEIPGLEASSREQVEDAALRLRSFWNVGLDGIVNVSGLLEEKGVVVAEVEAPDRFDGLFCIADGRIPVIALNKALDNERRRFAALRELGHLALRFPSAVPEKDIKRLCECFASEMLVPRKVFEKLLGRRGRIPLCQLDAIERRFGISTDAMVLKARDCRLISENRRRGYFMRKNSDPAFRSLVERPLYSGDERPARFENLVWEALGNDLITTSKAAVLLGVPLQDVREGLAATL